VSLQPNLFASKLGPEQRARDLKRAQTESFDVVVIGGGVTGTGVALDAASRGLSVCLVERRDYAAGTSSRSSKLIHGGLRYLEQKDFGLVREALHERKTLIQDVAPHLVRPAPFLLPLRKQYERPYIGAGVLLYDILAGRNSAVPHHRHLSKARCLEKFPSLDPNALVGGIQYYDAQIDDARHTVVVARTAASFGAALLPGVAVERILVEHGRAVGVEVTDRETGPDERVNANFAIRSRTVVNATGVWTSELERSAGVPNPLQVTASKGIHIVVPRHRIDATTALILRTDRSVLFVIPWGDRWILGTTDTPWSHDLDHPSASQADIHYVLYWANTMLRSNLTHDDVVGVYSGLRPLLSGGATATTKLSREHAVNRAIPGLVSIAGGKYTTYRLMARDAIDALKPDLGTLAPSPTATIGLLGADGHDRAMVNLAQHKATAHLPVGALAHLVARYGSTACEVLDVIAANPSLAAPIGVAPVTAATASGSSGSGSSSAGSDSSGSFTSGSAAVSPDPDTFDGAHTPFSGSRYLLGEAVHAATYEGAMHVDDVLTRRTRLSIEGDDRGIAAAPIVAAAMGKVLGWNSSLVDLEAKRYAERVRAERNAERADNDQGADDIRRSVRDPRLSAAQ
jgi:glycerol-3-phosphate dehydrogenase